MQRVIPVVQRVSETVVQRALIAGYAGQAIGELRSYAEQRVLPVHRDLLKKCKDAGFESDRIAEAKTKFELVKTEAKANRYAPAKTAIDEWIAALNALFEAYAAAHGSEEEKMSEHSKLSGDGLTNDELLAKAGGVWNDAWSAAPIPIPYAEVPEVVKTLIKFIHEEDSVVGAEYASMSKNDIAGMGGDTPFERQRRADPNEERRTNSSIVADPRRLRQRGTAVGGGENGAELAPVLREYEKGHYGLMRSWHIDDKGNLPDIRMNRNEPAFGQAKTRNYTAKNAEDFLMKQGAPSVVMDGVRDKGVQGGFQETATSDKRSLITTELGSWVGGVPSQSRDEEDAERRKAANKLNYAKKKMFGSDKTNVRLRPQGYAEYNLIGSWRVVYDYVNFKYYITDHYQRWKPRAYPDKQCNPFFEVQNVGSAQLSVDGEMELYRLRYWENRRREGLDTLA